MSSRVAPRQSPARGRWGLAGLLATVVATVGIRVAAAPPPYSALSGPLRALPVAAATGPAPGDVATPSGDPGASPEATQQPTTQQPFPVSSTAAAAPTSARPTHPAGAATSTSLRTVTGQAVDVGYGVVQVRLVLSGHRMVDVSTLSLPSNGRSGEISSYAAPLLKREAMQAQSATIDSVSGASYTSQGYAESLQSALDKVG